MPALQTLIRETREVTDHRLNVAAYQLVALVRKEVSDDEGTLIWRWCIIGAFA
jgi:hypothetical protein